VVLRRLPAASVGAVPGSRVRPLRGPGRRTRIEVPVQQAAPLPTGRGTRSGVATLQELATQLDTGAIYDRDLPELTAALNHVLEAFARRPHVRRRSDGR
jgi:hypothetical protein